MTRRMSCTLTVDAVRNRTKTVTRRDPNTWQNLRPGEKLILVEKVMGLRKGEKQVVLARVRIIHNWTEPLCYITASEVSKEGFPGWTPQQFADFYCREKGGDFSQIVRRIQWEYIEEGE